MQYRDDDYRPLVELARHDPAQARIFIDMPAQRSRYWALALSALMLALGVYLFLQTNQLLGRMQGAAADGDAMRIRQYNEKLESLQNRMTVFVADAVETKLKTLEKNVAAGTVGTQELRTLEELKGEVKLLETYSGGKRANLTDSSRLDHVRFQPTPGSQVAASGAGLLSEVEQMKRLLYVSIASCGVVGLMVGGYWWQSNSRFKRLAEPALKARLLAGRAEER